MYCPSCGSNNQDELKFCTRCGTNLGVVTDALSGKPAAHSPIDERLVNVFKDYYRGRNAVIIGGVASLIALFKVTLFALVGLPASTGFLGTLAGIFFFFGVIALVWGIAKWNNASSEIKAIERVSPRKSIDTHHGLLSAEGPANRTGALSPDPSTFRGSVTEQTTRQLEQSRPQLDNQSKQSQ